MAGGMAEPASDEALMLAYQAGAATAFDALYGRWRSRLFRYLRHQCGDAAVAEELYQDIWLRVIAARKSYEVAAKFSTWLFRIAHNRLVDHWRAMGRQAQEALASYDDHDEDCPNGLCIDPAASPDQLPERLLERRDLAERLVAAIGALPAAQREVFLLVEEGEMTLEEIANATGTGRETVKSRLRYALAKLRAELKEWQ
jgi:RNA polymerase sigma-70 factor (ECF subfamily)